jgi:hypothetical protein
MSTKRGRSTESSATVRELNKAVRERAATTRAAYTSIANAGRVRASSNPPV